MSKPQLTIVFEAIDTANSLDPNQEIVQGKSYPKELIYGQRMSKCLASFEPNASEALKVAVRCQHICRWEIPRTDYPATRTGYLEWRKALQNHHADKAAAILEELGYELNFIERVQFLIRKKQLKRDQETQTLEDVICLVFLEYYFAAFAATKSAEKMIDILQKTWRKMSAKGQAAALQLSYPQTVRLLLEKALA